MLIINILPLNIFIAIFLKKRILIIVIHHPFARDSLNSL